ncbi:unnamed protein product (macronuclear) [Paramecium tetraurelia]|uniref:EGF-like domain-containing protein n=1 Tax=Paramecium tetraurelia TaxID=5888 RepID=A0CHQ9_PARTE|nr:uncharacterized protein GSPATT00038428001 [Paramecium tetraurelia]CAK70326.1 unnamed protein product [Paramecium tetraurelia]|eukprot:XP_001437723.1 hypothetical protein (macronuclear) [Paramecium tetraurelia strain d4-2]
MKTTSSVNSHIGYINIITALILLNVIKYVINSEFKSDGLTYPGKSDQLKCGLGRCDYTNEPCSLSDDCGQILIENLKINDDGTIQPPIVQNQTCQKYCQQQLEIQPCKDTDPPPQEVLNPEILQQQKCFGSCNYTKDPCQMFSDCPKAQQTLVNQVQLENNTINITTIIQITQLCDSYKCSDSHKSCNKTADCFPFVAKSWELQDAICKKQDIYTKSEICKGFYYLQLKCRNIFSKALCIQMTNENCYFDLNQGGCIQLEGNEHKVPNCDSIKNTRKPTKQCDNFTNICRFSGQQQNEYQNTCQAVSSQLVQCKDSSEQSVADNSCPANTHHYITCVRDQNFQSSLSCIRVLNPSIFNCAAVADYCRYSNGVCISDQNTYPCKCDKSFSKSWCEFCKCNFDLLGYCQLESKPIQKLPDNSNQYYLCYEVNLLPIDADGKKKVCGMVDQACRYTFICEDATHYSCDYLLNLVVSKRACIRCNSLSVYYDEQKQFCKIQEDDIKQCNSLNKQACLQMTKGIKCKWEDYECKQIDRITGSDSRDCSIYNQDACIQFQQDCWFDQNIGYCTQFDPTQGSCNLLLNEDLCLFSLKESCLWDSINLKCMKNDNQITQCSDLNKFGCLNQSIMSCVWSDLYKCQWAILNDKVISCNSVLSNTQQSYITHFSQNICSQLKIQSSCFLDNYYQCRQTIITDIIKCNTQGLNKFGCINRSIGQCQFKDEQHQCIENTNDQIGCLDSLNKQACISQKQTCKFENNICSLHQVNTINDIINSTLLFVYSKSVCYAIDQQITDCLIYSEIQNRCINVSNRQPFIDNCYKFTMNKYACLQKTLQTCEYNQNENSCIQTSQQTLKTINNCFPEKYLNWISCISLPSNCKFNGIKCQSIDLKVDTCESLSKSIIYSQSFSLCNYK